MNHTQGRFSGSNFTRRGIFRNEEKIGALTAKAKFYEIGERGSTENNAS